TIGILIISRETKELDQLKVSFNLTLKETEVVRHIAEGYSNREMAEALHISEKTIKTHITNIFKILKVKNKIQLLDICKDYTLLAQNQSEK
ncbi:MAG: LuxR family transcriptional regulator, partial [Spirochaetales bacterium]